MDKKYTVRKVGTSVCLGFQGRAWPGPLKMGASQFAGCGCRSSWWLHRLVIRYFMSASPPWWSGSQTIFRRREADGEEVGMIRYRWGLTEEDLEAVGNSGIGRTCSGEDGSRSTRAMSSWADETGRDDLTECRNTVPLLVVKSLEIVYLPVWQRSRTTGASWKKRVWCYPCTSWALTFRAGFQFREGAIGGHASPFRLLFILVTACLALWHSGSSGLEMELGKRLWLVRRCQGEVKWARSMGHSFILYGCYKPEYEWAKKWKWQ